MDKKILAVYDISGIQDFIFSSNRLAENIGASLIVHRIFEVYLNEALLEHNSKFVKDKWIQSSNLEITNNDLDFEVIYIGGGNAMVAYGSKDLYVGINKKLSKKILEKTGNFLRLTTAFIETGFSDFYEDYQKLFLELKKNKSYKIQNSLPLLGLGITRLGPDNLPAQYYDTNKREYLSLQAENKRETYKNANVYDELLENCKDYKFTKDNDLLGQIEGENHIAIVHIDGNNMGKEILNLIEGEKDYTLAIQNIRKFSSEISLVYKSVLKEVIADLIDELRKDKKENKLNRIKIKNQILPIRPIVLNGDDVTFICDARLGLSLSEMFLDKLSKKEVVISKTKVIKLSACAGVVIVKSHFPFYRAVELAEELCSSAKKKGKLISKNTGKQMGNWIDFHAFQSGVTTSLNKIRSEQYNMPGKKEAIALEDNGNSIFKYKQHNLLWRPWCVSGDVNEMYKWSNFQYLFKKIVTGKDAWARNRLKKLRNSLINSEAEVSILLEEFKSRDISLPEFINNKKNIFFTNSDGMDLNQTPYFDILEMIDFFIDFGGNNEN